MADAATGRRGQAQPPTCPFLGLSRDRKAHSAVPTPQNRCYRDTTRAYAISAEHQSRYCFTSTHARCPAYAEGWAKAPAATRSTAGAARHRGAGLAAGSAYWSEGLILLVLVIAMFAALLFGASQGLISTPWGDPRATPTPTLPPGIQLPSR